MLSVAFTVNILHGHLIIWMNSLLFVIQKPMTISCNWCKHLCFLCSVYTFQNIAMIQKTNAASVPGKSLVSYFSWQCADLGSSKPHLTARAAANVHPTVTPMRKHQPLVSVKRIISGGSLIHPQWHAQVRKPTVFGDTNFHQLEETVWWSLLAI